MLNSVILIGRLTKDIQIRKSVNDKDYVAFSIAVSDGYGKNNSTSYINCFAWEAIAQNMAKYLAKGSLVAVNGRLRSRKNNVSNYSELFVDAREVRFLEPKRVKKENIIIEQDDEEEPVTKTKFKKETKVNSFSDDSKSNSENISASKNNQNEDVNEDETKDTITFSEEDIDW